MTYIAVKVLGDIQTKPLIGGRRITYSGEIVLGKVADTMGLSQVLAKYTKNEKEACMLRNIIIIIIIIILRALFNERKEGLVERVLPNLILEDKTDIEYVEMV